MVHIFISILLYQINIGFLHLQNTALVGRHFENASQLVLPEAGNQDLRSHAAHEFKMSVCEIVYSQKEEAFDVKFYLFQDDLKETLYGDPGADHLEADAVKNYILQKVKLSINGQGQPLAFRSMKNKEDQVLVVFSTPRHTLSNTSSILISNQLLVEKFRKQTNMVFVEMPGRAKLTQVLNAKKTEGEFEF